MLVSVPAPWMKIVTLIMQAGDASASYSDVSIVAVFPYPEGTTP